MSTTVKNSKMARRYGEDFKRQGVELMIHSGKTQRQVARELDVSEYSLNLWKKAYLGQQKPAEINGEVCSAPNYFVGLASERFVGKRPFGQILSWVVDREVAERRF